MTSSTQRIERVTEYTYDPASRGMVESKNTVADLTPLSATKDDCYSGWIRAINCIAPRIHAQAFKIDLALATKSGYQGKWIIPFAQKDPKIVEIWNRVREGVRVGVFCEAKVSIPSENFPEQVILVYTIDHHNRKDVAFRLKELIDRGIVASHATIFYKTESATLKGLDEYKYSSKDINGLASRISILASSIFRSFFAFIGNTTYSLGMRLFSLFCTKRT